MKERLKEWLLRKLVSDLMYRNYLVHLFTVIAQENAKMNYEDNDATQFEWLHRGLDLGVQRKINLEYKD